MGNVVLYFSNSVDTAFCFSGLCESVLMKYIYATKCVHFMFRADETFQKHISKQIANLLRHEVKRMKREQRKAKSFRQFSWVWLIFWHLPVFWENMFTRWWNNQNRSIWVYRWGFFFNWASFLSHKMVVRFSTPLVLFAWFPGRSLQSIQIIVNRIYLQGLVWSRRQAIKR